MVGVDVSRELLERARSMSVGLTGIEYVEGDVAEQSVLSGEEFDLVVCNFGLSDIDDLDGVCRTVARVLRPGGRFIFSILHPCFAGAERVSGSWPTLGSYYDEGWWRADGELSVLRQQVGGNHRTLSTYVNTLVRRGLASRPSWNPDRSATGRRQGPALARSRCTSSCGASERRSRSGPHYPLWGDTVATTIEGNVLCVP